MNVLINIKRSRNLRLVILIICGFITIIPLVCFAGRLCISKTTTDVYKKMELQQSSYTTTTDDLQKQEQQQSSYVALSFNRSQCSPVNETAECGGMNLNTIPKNLPIRITGLDLSNNTLENIDWQTLSRYKSISNLTMRNCNINTIPPDAFQKLLQLRHVDLSYNRLSHLNNQIFKYNTKLTEVLLSGNYLRWDPASPFLISFSITRLELRDCGIQQISNATFSEIKMLEYLDVSRNKVKVLDSRTFHYDVFRELLIDPVQEISTQLSTVCRNGTRVHYIFDDVRENWCETEKSLGIETTFLCLSIYTIAVGAVIILFVYSLYTMIHASRRRKCRNRQSPQ